MSSPRSGHIVAQGTSRPAINLGEITAGPLGEPEPDSETQEEEDDLDAQERRVRLRGIAQDINERRRYAGRIFWIIVFWLAGIFVLLLIQGALSPWRLFSLDDAVLIAAIGGTTVNVIGIFIVVARYLFPRRPDEMQPGERRPRSQARR
jgi:hypothetical protein